VMIHSGLKIDFKTFSQTENRNKSKITGFKF
jgi:hypothetical protein